MGKGSQPLRHIEYVDPRSEAFWGIRSLIPQWFPLISTVIAKVVVGIWTSISYSSHIGLAFLVSAFWMSAMLWLVCRHRLTWMLCDEQIHTLTHRTRDELDKILTCDDQELGHHVATFESHFVTSIADYFAKRLHNDTCGCCLRLVSVENGDNAYVTTARSASLGVGRAQNSEPIMESSKLIQSIKTAKSVGVWILNDMDAAIQDGLWPQMHNNGLRHFDSVMVAPVNTVIEGKKTMTGILFVTAKGRAFQPIHTIAMKAFADHFGAILPFLYPEEHVERQAILPIEQIKQQIPKKRIEDKSR